MIVLYGLVISPPLPCRDLVATQVRQQELEHANKILDGAAAATAAGEKQDRDEEMSSLTGEAWLFFVPLLLDGDGRTIKLPFKEYASAMNRLFGTWTQTLSDIASWDAEVFSCPSIVSLFLSLSLSLSLSPQ